MKTYTQLLAYAPSFLFSPAYAIAEDKVTDAPPGWFPLLEYFGVCLLTMAVVFLFVIVRRSGGKLASSFRLLITGLIIVVASLLWRSYCEAIDTSSWKTELIFELLLYLGLLVVTYSCYRFSKLLQ